MKPDFFVNSLLEIPLDVLKDKGIQGLIIDLDNTLTNWNCSVIDKEICKWLADLEKQGFKIIIVSNNSSERIEASLSKLNLPYVPYALKPRKRAFLKAMKILGTTVNTTAVIGDQLFTDILGGKRLGLTTILVPPLNKKEFIGTRIMRKLEKIILSRYL